MKNRKIYNQSKQDRSTDTLPEFINRFERYLKSRGYKHSTIRAYLGSIKHFIFWLKTEPPDKGNINREVVQTFLKQHLPVCCCVLPVRKEIKTVRAALNQFLLMEGHQLLRPIIHEASPEIEAVIGCFDKYLQELCGHSEATRCYHRRHVRMLLSWLIEERHKVHTQITPQIICRFVREQVNGYRSSSVGVLVYSLRTYLRFLQFNGHTAPSSVAMIPKPPNWSASSLPQALNSNQLIQFLAVFDRSTAIGKRDYAMARCLTDLGLRCCEVANIQLDAIDWHNCVLRLIKNKSRREEKLPIPDTTVKALVNYLRYGRPKTNSRAVFVYHRAPLGKAVQNTTVRGAIRRAYSRIDLPWTGTHILRNTFASRLLEGGASLKEIADVLRHRSINTTKSYTKIDLPNLSQVALPWPRRLS